MSTAEPATLAALDPLVDGEILDAKTFQARYQAMPPGIKAELIGGVVYMASPVGLRHSETHPDVIFWATSYRARTPGVRVSVDATTILDDAGVPQPDVLVRVDPACGGQSKDENGFISGAPEMVIEVSRSTRSADLGAKRLDYERAGVLEYVVVALEPDQVTWHVRRDDRLERIEADVDGLHRSGVFPGLWLDPAALLAGDVARLFEVVGRGVATPEHAAFVAKLEARRRGA